MLSENFDKKIKSAAEQHHPEYDEKAWLKMEKLLSRYLPLQKNDRRKFFFFLLVCLIVGGGAFLILSKPPKTVAHLIENVQPNAKNNVETKNSETNTGTEKIDAPGPGNENLVVLPQVKETFTGKSSDDQPLLTNGKNVPRLIKKGQVTHNKPKKSDVGEDGLEKIESDNMPPINPLTAKPTDGIRENGVNTDTQKDDEIKETIDEQMVKVQTKKSQKNKAHNKDGFSFSISAGPDVSKARSSKTGKTTLLFGAGIGYTRNRFTLRTGVYTSKKIYWAGPNDYKLSFSPPPLTKFEGADANCSVIEIPLKLGYSFGPGSKSNWFAAAGLSSYLMTREKYTYVYKTPSGSPYYHLYSTKNEHKHYFSVVNLSAGYTRNVNHFISLTAEPYVEIPVTGIGAGKVYLNSGGILFSVSIHPFNK